GNNARAFAAAVVGLQTRADQQRLQLHNRTVGDESGLRFDWSGMDDVLEYVHQHAVRVQLYADELSGRTSDQHLALRAGWLCHIRPWQQLPLLSDALLLPVVPDDLPGDEQEYPTLLVGSPDFGGQ